jgi:hypothetical protein
MVRKSVFWEFAWDSLNGDSLNLSKFLETLGLSLSLLQFHANSHEWLFINHLEALGRLKRLG